MDHLTARMNALIAGMTSAFALFPSHALDQFAKRESTESRMYANFARVGQRLDAAMSKVKDEQEAPRSSIR